MHIKQAVHKWAVSAANAEGREANIRSGLTGNSGL